MSFTEHLKSAHERRQQLIEKLDHTTCYRLFHGVAEGRPGLAVDRYGPALLVQTWRDPASAEELDAIEAILSNGLPMAVWHRAGGGRADRVPTGVTEFVGTELGLRFDVTPPTDHRGQDPLLFLDFRAARRWVRANAQGKSVLNLFSYTCGIGVAAAAGGASEVLNVDFAQSALDVGRTNAKLNGLKMGFHHENALPVMRFLAGLSLGARRGRQPAFNKPDKRPYDLVVLDPPRWAKTPWGAIDVTRDYASLFKPALLSTSVGGTLLVTNHVPKVALDDWVDSLQRCAKKAGRPLVGLDILECENDFPSFDGNHPLKMAICHV